MSEDIKKIGIPTTAIAMALLMIAPASLGAFAIAPTDTTRSGGLHFVGQPDLQVVKTDDTAFLRVTGEVAGAGTGGTATLSSTAIVTVGCITPPGNNEPTGLQTDTQTVLGTADLEITRQGRGTFDVQTTEVTIPSDFECPSANMEETLVSVLFTEIVLTINAQTGTITATFEDVDP